MKKILFAFMALFFGASISAQNSVQNGSFENWTSGGLFTQEQPTDWTASLVGNVTQELYGFEIPIPINVYFGSKTTDAHAGTYALKLQASNVGIPNTQYDFLCPGVAQLGHAEGFSIPLSTIMDIANIVSNQDTFELGNIDFESLSSLTKIIAPGMPCSQTPYRINFWAKYFPSGTDSMSVFAFTKLNGELNAFASLKIGKSLPEYVQVSVDFDAPLTPCDSICIIFISGGFSTNSETVLYVDDVELDYTTSIEPDEEDIFSLYPNPAKDNLFIRPFSTRIFSYKITDMMGRNLKMDKAEGNTKVNIQDLPSGIYLLQITQGQQSVTRKIVIR